MTAVIGSAPSTPQMVLPAPCAMSSLSYWVRGPSCSRSTAAALKRLSAEAIRVKATIVPMMPMSTLPKASRPGGWMDSSRPFTSTVATGRSKTALAAIARITAASAPGTACAFFGSFFHSTITVMVAAPRAREVSAAVLPAASTAAPGRPRILSMPEAGAFSPAVAYSWPAMSTRPIPASMPSTTETDIARNQRPSFIAPMASWSRPAASTMTPSAGSP